MLQPPACGLIMTGGFPEARKIAHVAHQQLFAPDRQRQVRVGATSRLRLDPPILASIASEDNQGMKPGLRNSGHGSAKHVVELHLARASEALDSLESGMHPQKERKGYW